MNSSESEDSNGSLNNESVAEDTTATSVDVTAATADSTADLESK